MFWIKFAQKGYFRSKTEKVTITTEFCIFQLVYVFWISGPNLHKRGISTNKWWSNSDYVCPRLSRIMRNFMAFCWITLYHYCLMSLLPNSPEKTNIFLQTARDCLKQIQIHRNVLLPQKSTERIQISFWFMKYIHLFKLCERT